MQSETRIDTRVKINTSIAGNVTKYNNLHMQESFDNKILTLPNFTYKKIRCGEPKWHLVEETELSVSVLLSESFCFETELLLTALDNFNIICIKHFHKESINNKVSRRYMWLIQLKSLKSIKKFFVTEVLNCTCPRTTSKHRHDSFDWYTLHEFWATMFNKLKII